jgi:hypothetical protein
LYPKDGPVHAIQATIFQLGLLLLMFSVGAEIRNVFRRQG